MARGLRSHREMRAVSLLLASLLALAGCGRSKPPAVKVQQENPKEGPTTKWKADLKLTLEQKGKEWVFILQGTTNVPKEVVLKARVYAVELVNDPVQGKREDEEQLVWEDEDGQPSLKPVDFTGGKFREEIYHFAKKPWCLFYRGRIHYRSRDQAEAVVQAYGDDDWSVGADLHFGTEAEYGEQLRVGVKEATDDLMTLEKLYNEIRHKVDEQRQKADPAAWAAWKGTWISKIEDIEITNKLRYNLWAVWMERQAKMRVGGMCVLLDRIAKGYTEQFAAPKPEFTHLEEMVEGWHNYFEEAIEVIGIDAPLDIERVGPLVRDYETAFAPLRAWIEKGQGEDVRRDARRDCLSALFKIPPLLQNRKRAYKFVNELSLRFTRLLEATDAPASPEIAAAVRKALEEHDEALRDFKKFGGLK
jgi:hypothetical protein